MITLFCSDPLNSRIVDPAFEREAAAANRAGANVAFIDFEALTYEADANKAARRVARVAKPTIGIYRGWMIKPSQYAQLYAALNDQGVILLNSPAAYEHCHCLPCWYSRLEAHTPKSVWTERDEKLTMSHLVDVLKPFGDRPVIVKDWVKSRKHEWAEACYIPSASDAVSAGRVIARFLELQGDDLNVGLVFREFVEFEGVGKHARSGMPLTKEFRLFFLRGKLIHVSRYWDEGEYGDDLPPVEYFSRLAALVDSLFFAMDVAKSRAGGWMVVELGDGQVAELPDDADLDAFFHELGQACDSANVSSVR